MSAIVEPFEAVGDFFEEQVDLIGQGLEQIGKGLEEAGRWMYQATKDVGKFLDDATSKDGWLTNFVQDYIPGGGLVTAAVHAAAGNFDYAEYAAVKGASTLAQAAITVAGGMLLGPAGAILGGMVAGAVGNLFESGMKKYLQASVKDKIADFSAESLLLDVGIGGLAGGLGAAARGPIGRLKNFAKKQFNRLRNVLRRGANTFRRVPKPPIPLFKPHNPVKPDGLIRKLRNRVRVFRGKPPIAPRLNTFGPKGRLPTFRDKFKANLTKKAGIGAVVAPTPLGQEAQRRRLQEEQRRKRQEAIDAIWDWIIGILILVAILIMILVLVLVLGSTPKAKAPGSGTLNPSPKVQVPADGGEVAAPGAPVDPADPAAPGDGGQPVAPGGPTPGAPAGPAQPGDDFLTVVSRQGTCAGRLDAVDARLTTPSTEEDFTIVFTSSTAGSRQANGFSDGQGRISFILPVSGPGEVLTVQSATVDGRPVDTNWGSYTVPTPGFPCDPTATVNFRDVCYDQQGQVYYLVLAFDSPASPGQTAVLRLTADPVGDAEPDTSTVEEGGEIVYYVSGVEPGWRITLLSITVDGVAYSDDFGSYLVPETEQVC